MSACALCNNIADYLIDAIICHGSCRKLLHIKCINAPLSSINLFEHRKSFYFFCEDCDPFAYTNIVRDVLQNKQNLDNLHNQLLQLNKKIEDITSNQNVVQNLDYLIVNNPSTSDSSHLKRKLDKIDTEISETSHLTKKPATAIVINSSQESTNNTTRQEQSVDINASKELSTSNQCNFSSVSANTSSTTTTFSLPTQSNTNTPHHEQPVDLDAPKEFVTSNECISLPSCLAATNTTSTINPPSTMIDQHPINMITSPVHTSPLTASTTDRNFVSPFESGLKIVEGHKTLFISKLTPSTNALDVKCHIKSKIGTLNSIAVEKILHRNYSKYSSFKIKLPDSVFYLLNSSSFWPNGIVMHEYQNRRSNYNSHHFQNRLTMRLNQSSYKNY